MKSIVLILVIFLISATADADILYLKNGGRLEGKVTEKNLSVEIQLPTGTLAIPRSQIKKIERSISKMEQYQALKSVLGVTDVEGRYQLALWCRENKLKELYLKELQQIIAQDPDHAKARSSLGYERHEGRWVTHDQAMALRGYVKFRGAWTTPAQRDGIMLDEMQKQFEEEKDKRKAAEQRVERAEQRIYALELQLARLSGQVQELAEAANRRRYIIIKKHYPYPTTESETGQIDSEK